MRTELGLTRALDIETGGDWVGGGSQQITEMTADSKREETRLKE